MKANALRQVTILFVSDVANDCMDLSGIDFDDEVEEVKKVVVKPEPQKNFAEKAKSHIT